MSIIAGLIVSVSTALMSVVYIASFFNEGEGEGQ